MTSVNRWRLTADRTACMGTGICAAVAPHHFQVTDGRSSPSVETTLPDETVRDAVESCPMEALRILDAGSGQVLAPS